MNYMLKIDPVDLLALDVLLKHILETNPDKEVLQKHLGRIHKNVVTKKQAYQSDLAEIEQAFSPVFSKYFNEPKHDSSNDTKTLLDKSIYKTCSDCQYNRGRCQKEDEIREYWGWDEKEFLDYRDEHNLVGAERCLMFMHEIRYTIIGPSRINKGLYDVEVRENGATEHAQFSPKSLRLYAHKYGTYCIVNYDEYKEIL